MEDAGRQEGRSSSMTCFLLGLFPKCRISDGFAGENLGQKAGEVQFLGKVAGLPDSDATRGGQGNRRHPVV